MTDRTSDSTFDDAGSNVGYISGIASASNDDTIKLPRKCKTIICQTSNDDDEIATAALSSDGLTATFGLVDDAGSAGTTANLF